MDASSDVGKARGASRSFPKTLSALGTGMMQAFGLDELMTLRQTKRQVA